jgi:hypothetical protein
VRRPRRARAHRGDRVRASTALGGATNPTFAESDAVLRRPRAAACEEGGEERGSAGVFPWRQDLVLELKRRVAELAR